MNNVLVIGSINMDLVVSADRFPAPGETRFFRLLQACRGRSEKTRLGTDPV